MEDARTSGVKRKERDESKGGGNGGFGFSLGGAGKKRRVEKDTGAGSVFDEDEEMQETEGKFVSVATVNTRSKLSLFGEEDDEEEKGRKGDEDEKEALVIPLPEPKKMDPKVVRKFKSTMARLARGEIPGEEEEEEEDEEMGEKVDSGDGEEQFQLPLLLRHRDLETLGNADEEVRFQKDVASRPDPADLQSYERTPIESFGEALLRGMNWTPGMRLGKNQKGLAKPVEAQRRHHRLGLGATPKPPGLADKRGGPSEAERKADEKKTRSEALITVETSLGKTHYERGALVLLNAGRHKGVHGKLIGYDSGAAKARVEFSSGEVILIEISRLEFVDRVQFSKDESSKRRGGESDERRERKSGDRKNSERYRNSSERRDDERKSERERRREEGKRRKETWMAPGIMVRIVSKSLGDGRYYCKKARIEDVLTLDQCTLTFEGKVIDVKQRHIETALPKPGGRVLVLRGSNKGRKGTLQERQSKKNKAVVQHEDDLSIGTYRFEDVAQFVG